MPKTNKANDPTGPRRQRASAFTEKVMQMRAMRVPYPAIAAQLGRSESGVRMAAKRGLKAISEKIEEISKQVRELDLIAIDQMQYALYDAIHEGSPADRTRAIQTSVSLLKRRAEILGYDAPVKSQSDNRNTHLLAEPFLTREQMAAAVQKGVAEHRAAVAKQQAIEGTTTHHPDNPGDVAPTTEDLADSIGNQMESDITNRPAGMLMANGRPARVGALATVKRRYIS